MSGKDKNLHNMSESDSEQEDVGKEGIEWIMNLPDVPMKLPPHVELQRTRVECKADAPIHTDTIQYSGAYASLGIDNSLRLDSFRKNFKIEVIDLKEDDMEFDMIGIDPSLANAFRRILIAEVPTMAIEKVLVANNTSIVQDEVLAHRLGLIPIRVDPRLFEYSDKDTPNEKNTIVFRLHVRCERGKPRLTATSKALTWLPNGSEFPLVSDKSVSNTKPKTYTSFSCSQDTLPEFANNPIGPKDGDIILARLSSGQEIELEAHAVKGMGKTHAKWSPVATAWYRMLPEVVLLEDIEDELAEELKNKCPVNVFDIEDIANGKKRATVARPRACTLCRECIRGEAWEKRVSLRRVKDHFIFKIESTGALPPEVLFTEAVKILEDKCERLIAELS
ncbi:DNA-directed RNA polymerases I and III subunit RPAC1 [Cucurbita moschata]|uniref:DNA-directed RNA polymerases I and III subunit RPAC1 n=2 Tax=Cucurbita TaxID=3660 RepID=A0A6J1FDA3_CUCMO|nr:DNA-directed RNA polymerases I and III subunit RPAC1 [Cucurbita moschata]XP_022936440.1 DNA-directed RNA polymerases I and III subunit RPAC1 [Cucurbita moschata]XP_022936448.1 DNA-directed RNA polymerases I and III subunit RPAC1 [Cucurbita moschata]